MGTALDPIWKRFWLAYGGARALFTSRYLMCAIALTPFCWGSWSNQNWWTTVINVLPGLLGFTLGGFAIFVALGDRQFIASLAATESDADKPSVYRELCATFVHFIFVQVIALILAVITKGMWFEINLPQWVARTLPIGNIIWGGICYLVFLYALTSVIAVAVHVFRIATMYEFYHRTTDGRTARKGEPQAFPAHSSDGKV